MVLASIISLTKARLLLKEVTIAHLLESSGRGRIRLVYPRLKRDPGVRSNIEAELNKIREVQDYAINEITGSVLIHYDAARIEKGSFLHTLLSEAKKQYLGGRHAD